MGVSDIELKWDKFKSLLDSKGICAQYVDDGKMYNMQLIDGQFHVFCRIGKTDPVNDEQLDFETNYKPDANKPIDIRTDDGLQTQSVNRIPFGYTIFPTGVSDDHVAGTFGDGDELFMDKDNLTADFQMINHWYAIGGDSSWGSGVSNRDKISATLYAMATMGTNGAGFDFIKAPTGLGFNLFVYVGTGNGDWDLDLTSPLHAGKEMLKVTPVPVAGNTGFFDFDKKTNTLKPNATQTGGYNLYDIELPLFSFARYLWGHAGGGTRPFKEPDVVGKLLYANWFIRFQLTIHDAANRTNDDVSVGLNMITGVKKNI